MPDESNNNKIPLLELRVQRVEETARTLTTEGQQFYKTEWPAVRSALQAIPALKEELAALRTELRATIALPGRLDALLERIREMEARHMKKQDEIDKELANLKRFTWLLTGGGVVVWGLAQLLARVWHAPP